MAILANAGSYVFSTASCYMFRQDASTSTSPPSPPRPDLQLTSHRSSSNPSSLPSSSSSNSSPPTAPTPREKTPGETMVDLINNTEDLYKILGIGRRAKSEEVRKAFLMRSRICHPDKLPDYAPATPAFQRLSFAYETLSKQGSRRIYDLGGGTRFEFRPKGPSTKESGDETLHSVLRSVFAEFLAGDFEMIRVFVNSLNEGNPGLNIEEETIDNFETAFRRVRDMVLTGNKYMGIFKFEFIRLYEIQQTIRTLGYFDFVGRARLTLALSRITLEIPLVLDRAMRAEPVNPPQREERERERRRRRRNGEEEAEGEKEEGEEEREFREERKRRERYAEGAGGAGLDRAEGSHEGEGEGENEGEREGANTGSREGDSTNANGGPGELQSRGLLGPRAKGILVMACKMLEKGEKFGT